MDTTIATITTIREVGKYDGQAVIIRGWLYNLRESGKLLFPQFRDGSGIILEREEGPLHDHADAGVERDRDGQSTRRQARAWRL